MYGAPSDHVSVDARSSSHVKSSSGDRGIDETGVPMSRPSYGRAILWELHRHGGRGRNNNIMELENPSEPSAGDGAGSIATAQLANSAGARDHHAALDGDVASFRACSATLEDRIFAPVHEGDSCRRHGRERGATSSGWAGDGEEDQRHSQPARQSSNDPEEVHRDPAPEGRGPRRKKKKLIQCQISTAIVYRAQRCFDTQSDGRCCGPRGGCTSACR